MSTVAQDNLFQIEKTARKCEKVRRNVQRFTNKNARHTQSHILVGKNCLVWKSITFRFDLMLITTIHSNKTFDFSRGFVLLTAKVLRIVPDIIEKQSVRSIGKVWWYNQSQE